MNDFSPALLADLSFAVGRYGLTIQEVPRDHLGKTITDRLAMLVGDGESYARSEFRRTDLRSETANVWQLFPENPATIQTQLQLMDEVSELMHEEETFHAEPRLRIVHGQSLPTREHVDALVGLLTYIEGTGPAPDTDPSMWSGTDLFDEAALVVPGLREAEVAAQTRAQLVEELAEGHVPPASAVYVRRALDSEADGLRNADITLAGYRVSAERLRDAAQLALDALMPHFEVAERIRKLRDDLELIEHALHWPGHWRTAPRLRELAEADAAA